MEAVRLDVELDMPIPAVFISGSAAGPLASAAAPSDRVAASREVAEDNPVSSDEDLDTVLEMRLEDAGPGAEQARLRAEAVSRGAGSDDDSGIYDSDDDSSDSDSELFQALRVIALDTCTDEVTSAGTGTGCNAELKSALASAIVEACDDVEAVDPAELEPELGRCPASLPTSSGSSSAGFQLPAGMMLTKCSAGWLQQVWVSRAMALLAFSPRISTDRMVRISETAKIAATNVTDLSELDWMVACGTTCACRYDDKVYYGWLARYGFVNAKDGLSAELSKPVSIQPGKKVAGLTFWFVWYEEAGALDGVPLYKKTLKDTLQSGMGFGDPLLLTVDPLLLTVDCHNTNGMLCIACTALFQ